MPENENQKYYDYLITLRNTGKINMMAAVPYLERDFGLTKEEAKTILFAWMKLPD
jgi:hypothetical protein